MQTFKCEFGKGVMCEMQVTDEAPEKGKQHIQKMEWSEKPSKNMLRPYIAWVNSVNKMLADKWNLKIMHIFQIKPTPTSWEIWSYAPNQQPKRVKVI